MPDVRSSNVDAVFEPRRTALAGRHPLRYRLTMYPSFGTVPATNEWRRVTETEVAAFREDRDNRREAALARRRRKA